jgi:hypothetical protein
VACDVVGGSTCELIRFFNNLIVEFEERQNILYSTTHIVEMMRTRFPARCLLKLCTDKFQKARGVGSGHNKLLPIVERETETGLEFISVRRKSP